MGRALLEGEEGSEVQVLHNHVLGHHLAFVHAEEAGAYLSPGLDGGDVEEDRGGFLK